MAGIPIFEMSSIFSFFFVKPKDYLGIMETIKNDHSGKSLGRKLYQSWAHHLVGRASRKPLFQ